MENPSLSAQSRQPMLPLAAVSRFSVIPAIIFLFALAPCATVYAQATYRAATAYEDTVRIVILWNDEPGLCSTLTDVGRQTLDFVVKALDTTRIHHVRILRNGDPFPTLSDIQAVFGAGTLPHVIVHVNAGWGTTQSGPNMASIMQWAVQNYIGVVSIGDDASWLSTNVFGFQAVNNMPPPMHDARWLDKANDSLLINMHPGRDTLVDSLVYPYLNGIVTNASRKILHDSTLYFKDYLTVDPNGRCQADADAYTVLSGYEDNVWFLGYQRGYNATQEDSDNPGTQGYIGSVDQWNVIAAFQDSALNGTTFSIRRGVALSFQPQFLKNAVASQQLVYDAIMFGSLAHKLRPPALLALNITNDTIIAGTHLNIQAFLIDDIGDTISIDSSLYDNVTWRIVSAIQPGDTLFDSLGQSTILTGTQAYRLILVEAIFQDPYIPAFRFTVTARIRVAPGAPHHADLISSSTVRDSIRDETLANLTLTETQTSTSVYAVVRDRYGNFIRYAQNAIWQSDSVSVATVTGMAGSLWQGQILKEGPGVTWISVSETGLLPDSVMVTARVARVELISAVTRDVNGNGYLDRIECEFDSLVLWPVPTIGVTVTYGNTAFIVDSVGGAGGTARTRFTLFLSENHTSDLQTGWRPVISMPAFDNVPAVSSFMCSDGAPPVITHALYYPAPLRGQGGSPAVSDSLRIAFSEPVRWTNNSITASQAFYYLDAATPNASAFSGISASDMDRQALIARILMTNGFEVEPLIDSLKFAWAEVVLTDTSGNAPASNNRTVPIQWGVENRMQLVTINNPFVAGQTPLPVTVASYYQNVIINSGSSANSSTPGTIVAIQSLKPLARRSDGSYGAAIAYDAVGSIVKEGIRVNRASGDLTEYGLFWDGRNRNGRFVGGGTYLFVVSAEDVDGTSLKKRVKIGVRRR